MQLQAQEAEVEKAFTSMGSNLIFIVPGAPNAAGQGGMVGSAATLTLEDAEAIARDAPSVAAVAPIVQVYAQIVAGRENVKSSVAGVTPQHQQVNNFEIAQGSFITEYDYGAKTRVAVLGSAIAENLFGKLDPTGQDIRIDGRKFKVIGVLTTKGMGFGTEDLTVYIPLSTIQSTLAAGQVTGQGHSVQAISIQAKSEDTIDSALEEVTAILRERHRLREGEENDFTVISMESIANQAGQMLGLLQLILGAIAGISLLVGGIGIMNIMLVSVTERIREIGLRKAIGAKRRDILIQFLTEAAILSLCGGAIGVGIGWVIVNIMSMITASAGFPISVTLSGGVVVVALAISIIIGLVSGIYPALRAARLDPIESLRHE